MNSPSQQNQDELKASDEGLPESAFEGAQPLTSLTKRVTKLEQELTAQHHIIEALTAELTTRDIQVNAILSSRAWRWVSRYSRIKRGYIVPAYEFVRGLFGNGKVDEVFKRQPDQASLVAPRPVQLEPEHSSLVLLPRPGIKKLSFDSSRASAGPRARADVICFSIVDWSYQYQRPQQIISQFAEQGHRVFYIRLDHNLPANAEPGFSITKLKENVYQVTLAADRRIWISQEDIRSGNAHRLLTSLAELRQAFHIDEAIGYVMIPSWTTIALEARARWGWRIIYDCMDEWTGFPGMGWAITQAEGKLVRQCDLLVVTAQRLYDKWRNLNRPMVLARNAVDYEFYSKRLQPNSLLAGVEHPIVGYFGAIADWFDLELMIHVASSRPNYTFVLLGGVFEVDVSELAGLPNVKLLGQQPYESMPQYLYSFDACVIPFRTNATTAATDPVKAYEYLSSGKPIVSVDLPELHQFSEFLYIAKDRDDFVRKLDQALAEKDPQMVEQRRSFASRNTWQNRYQVISQGLSETAALASIIIVTYNNFALNRLCLESILRNTDYPNYEVIVVDNNSRDQTPAYLRQMEEQHPHIKIILNSDNRGFAAANNQGLATSSGDRLVLLNNDTIVPPGWLSRLLRHLEDPAIGLVGPVTNFTGNEARVPVDYKTLGEMETFADELMWSNTGRLADIHMLAMFCVALRRELYERIGPLDEQFGIGMFEDDDYSLRVKECKLRVVCAADVFVHHVGQAAFKELIVDGSYDGLFTENRRRYESKWNVKWIPHKNAPLKFGPSKFRTVSSRRSEV